LVFLCPKEIEREREKESKSKSKSQSQSDSKKGARAGKSGIVCTVNNP
jgi:hypothetical protein